MSALSKFVVGGAALVAGVALTAAAANAAVITPTITTSGDTETGTFGNSFSTNHSTTSFTDTIAFTLSKAGQFSGSVSASSVGSNVIKLTSVVLTGGGTDPYSITTTPGTYFANLSPLSLGAGNYVITVMGTEKNTVSYTGNFTFLAVPEPATWAMMIGGLGLLGLAVRRRRELAGAAA